ncbi:circadian locomoter output cycles protein kaput-like isoform X3 [Haliotis cracherodii]|uniref:circadian locomoter output cycles protein kaput-like isoform X3 n=1 Tax=Haliotis cracherodii TaxID=6455 RepID=UPI0039EB4E1F
MNYGKRIALIPLPTKCSSVKSMKASSSISSNMNTDRKTRNLSEKKRRDQFNMLVNELCSMVSVNNKKMDKSTVLKSTIAFLKNHQEIAVQSQIHEIKEDWKPSFLSNDEFSQLMLEALDSFLIVFTVKGKILYVSESVTSLLGHLPSDLVTKSLFNLLHEYDREKVSNFLQDFHSMANTSAEFGKEENQISFKCHVQCGAINPQDLRVFEEVEFTGTCRPWDGDEDAQSDTDSYVYMRSPPVDSTCLCCTVRLQTTKIIREMPIQTDLASEFTSRHSLGWKFLFLDHRAPPVIGYLPFELLGTSGYDYYHPDDLDNIARCHEQLMQTGEGTSCHYRFLTKGQQWIWLKTHYYITYHQWNSKPEFIVCTNTVVSFSEVRSSIRKEMGMTEEEDSEMVSVDETEMEKGQHSPSCSVTSGPASHQLSAAVQSETPDATVTGVNQLEVSESSQMPHSTQLDRGISSKPLTSNLQTYLQQQPTQSQTAQEITTSPSTPVLPHVLPRGMVPVNIMSLPHGMLAVQQNQLSRVSMGDAVSVVPSLSPAPVMSPQENLLQQPQIFMTRAQRLLHDQLLHKSEQLQDAIRHQQEELRQITEQLTRAQHLSTPVVQGNSPTLAARHLSTPEVQGNSSTLAAQHLSTPIVQGNSPTLAAQHLSTPVVQGNSPTLAAQHLSTPEVQGNSPTLAAQHLSTPVVQGNSPTLAARHLSTPEVQGNSPTLAAQHLSTPVVQGNSPTLAARHLSTPEVQGNSPTLAAQHLSTPVVQGPPPDSSHSLILQPQVQPMTMAATGQQVMMIPQMSTLSVIKQPQQIQLHQQVQIQQVQQHQLQPCLPFQIVPEADDVNFNNQEMSDN